MNASKTIFDLRTISIAVIISLIVGAGAGYMVGNSPVSNLTEEKDWLEAEYDLLETEHDTLYSYLQSVETELDSAQESLVELQRNNNLLMERYGEMLLIDQENQVLHQQIIELENQTETQFQTIQNYVSVIETLESEIDELNSQLNVLSEYSQILEAQLSELLDPGSSSASYRGRLDTWYHYRRVNTEEVNPLYDAKVIDGSWSLVDLGNGVFSLMMRWTELNIDEEAEGAPPGTYDSFVVTLQTQGINIVEDPDFPGMFVLYGDAYWRKTHWDGTVGYWTRRVHIDIMPYYYDHQFRYCELVGIGNEFFIYGSFYPS